MQNDSRVVLCQTLSAAAKKGRPLLFWRLCCQAVGTNNILTFRTKWFFVYFWTIHIIYISCKVVTITGCDTCTCTKGSDPPLMYVYIRVDQNLKLNKFVYGTYEHVLNYNTGWEIHNTFRRSTLQCFGVWWPVLPLYYVTLLFRCPYIGVDSLMFDFAPL